MYTAVKNDANSFTLIGLLSMADATFGLFGGIAVLTFVCVRKEEVEGSFFGGTTFAKGEELTVGLLKSDAPSGRGPPLRGFEIMEEVLGSEVFVGGAGGG